MGDGDEMYEFDDNTITANAIIAPLECKLNTLRGGVGDISRIPKLIIKYISTISQQHKDALWRKLQVMSTVLH